MLHHFTPPAAPRAMPRALFANDSSCAASRACRARSCWRAECPRGGPAVVSRHLCALVILFANIILNIVIHFGSGQYVSYM